MGTRTMLAALIIASILPATANQSLAASSQPSTLDQPPQAIVSSEWAGIWLVHEETRDCTTGQVTAMNSYVDTLCTGGAYILMPGQYLDYGGYHYATCSGVGFTDAAFDLSCSVSATCGSLCPCNATVFETAHYARNGDEATSTVTKRANFGGFPGCYPPNQCSVTTATWTRFSPALAECGTTPTLPTTWGTLKQLYR